VFYLLKIINHLLIKTMNILDLMEGVLGGGAMETLAKQVGSDRVTTQTAAQGAVSALLGAISKNASTPQGAASLVSSSDLDHDGSVMDDFQSLIIGQKSPYNPNILHCD